MRDTPSDLADQLQRALGDRYRVMTRLHGGGMSTLFLARDTQLERRIVIKVLSSELATAEGIARFHQEIDLIASFAHPQVVPLLATGDVAGLPYFVMPYVDGESLRARLERGPMSVRETVSILIDAARALSAAHARGIVHRDIKPDNILLTGLSAVVTDFGVAKARTGARPARAPAPNTSEGTSLGTPAYMAPEQIAGGPDVDARADLYALGVVGYEMLTGAPPFASATSRKVLTAHLTETPRPISTHRSDVPRAVEALIMRCLAKDPADRPRNAGEIIRELQSPDAPARPHWHLTWTDLRGAVRGLLAAPTITIYAALCLALGAGATLAVYSAIDQALIQALPFEHAGELFTFSRTTPQGVFSEWSAPTLIDLSRSLHSTRQVAAITGGPGILVLPTDAVQVSVIRASTNFFATLGMQAQAGRLFDSSDANAPAPVAVLSNEAWHGRFAADPAVIGRSITLDGKGATIVGILPPDFRVPNANGGLTGDIWIPLAWTANERAERGFNFLAVFGRLARGASFAQAERELTVRMADITRAFPDFRGESIRLSGLQTDRELGLRTPLLLLLGAVGLVLLVAVANVVCLLLARGVQRQREFAIRSALGGSTWAVIRPVLVESGLLAVAGVAGGALVGWLAIRLAGGHVAADVPQLVGLSVGVRTLPFAFGLAALIATLAGVLPAWRGARVDPQDALRGGRTSGSAKQSRVLDALVVTEVALSLVLLVGAGVVLKAFVHLLEVDPGFDAAPVLTLETSVSRLGYADGDALSRFLRPTLASIAQVPGIGAVGAISTPLFRGRALNTNVRYEGRPNVPEDLPLAEFRFVTPGLFAVTQQRLIAGRLLRDDDVTREAPPVVVVNRALAARDFAGQDPVGKRFYVNDSTLATIVGVVSDIRNAGSIEAPRPEIDYPYPSRADSHSRIASLQLDVQFTLMARVDHGDPRVTQESIRAAIRGVDPGAAVTRMMPMRDVIAASVRRQRFFAAAILLFAAIAVTLATAGVHGVLAYTVARRSREIGIRTALGSSPRRSIALVLHRGMRLVTGGIIVGLVAAGLTTGVLRSLVYGVKPVDPVTWFVAAMGLFVLGLVASVAPAWRAASVNPVSAIRADG